MAPQISGFLQQLHLVAQLTPVVSQKAEVVSDQHTEQIHDDSELQAECCAACPSEECKHIFVFYGITKMDHTMASQPKWF